MKLDEFLDYQRKLWEMDKRKYETYKMPQNNCDKKANKNTKPAKK
ncbi:hypothetical protein [Ruminiclostridium cellulolyticum]|uniref:Uncharacterized protein n=1 Tax=Ruminiclostridium cellulolyticum (strain ATCC 35319 / DSM 5812 / JCM 6584 / H10) TaxID=394503 RepID=B8I296_RUMCH|nr:hypothetical protein [Ruminiclostridium cellulolyticum]ACL77759.1 hypothetical protein Ccel_3471 [Ruminiclostridium cellulolyticum H10]